MIRKFSVKNFKNFKDEIIVDFTKVHDYQYNEYCITDNLISKMIIYGKNAVGKTNLGDAIFDISYSTYSIRSPRIFFDNNTLYKNADADQTDMIEFFYSFQFGSDIVEYSYNKADIDRITAEELIINNEVVFSYDLISGEKDFNNISKINAQELDWDNFISIKKSDSDNIEETQPSALRYIIFNTVKNQDDIFYKLANFIRMMRLSTSSLPYHLRIALSQVIENNDELSKFEEFLNKYGVKCKLKMLESVDGKKEIYFDYKKPLSFASNLSSGTKMLTRFYVQYLIGQKPSFLFFDEFDAFYHYELSEKIVKLLEEEFKCQVILTSHNTNLLSNSVMRPDCFMILSNGKLTPICEATTRELRQGHNLEKLYINGEFEV